MKFWKNLKSGGGDRNSGRFCALDRSNNNGSNSNKAQQQQLQRRSCHGGSSLGTKLRARLSGGNSQRESKDTSDGIYEDFGTMRSNGSGCSTPSMSSAHHFGTTFVELIKRQGTRLGVSVTAEQPPRITELAPGSWARAVSAGTRRA